MSKVILCLAWGSVLAAPAWAIEVYTPPWEVNRGDPQWAGGSTTTQSWEFWGNQPGTTTPVDWHNPTNQPPTFTPVNATAGFVSNGPTLTGVNTWHVDADGGGFDLMIPNDPKDRPQKVIHLQYTSDKSSMAPPTSNPPGTVAAGGVAEHLNGWQTYEWTITIQPNPPFEVISVRFPESTDIGEIDVATICVPEPVTLSLLALGGLAMLRRRRT